MNDSDKFLRLFGGIFFGVGVLLATIGLSIVIIFREWIGGGIPLLMSLIFGGIGGGILLVQMKRAGKRRNILENGVRYAGKIYGYVEDRSCMINGAYPINIKVRYFDRNGIEREAIIPTGFTKGAGDYPIGATIDIVALDTSYTWIKDSVRFEHIAREEELMDNKPINTNMLEMKAVRCPNCGAGFSAAKGYVSNCPYCGSVIEC